MGKFQKTQFGEVTAFKMACGLGRRPLVTVYCYLVDGVLIDTGPRHMREQLLKGLQGEPLNQVLLTHHHEDHSGNSAAIYAHWGVPVYGHDYARQKLAAGYKILPYQHLLFGATTPVPMAPLPALIETDHLQLTPLYTPGHSKDHTVYWEKSRGWLFLGDLYVGTRIKFFRVDEDFGQTLASLRTIADLDFTRLYCAHNPQMQNGKQCVREKLAFFEDFLGELAHLRDHQGMDSRAVVRHLSHRGDPLVRWITFGNASFDHLVRSAWRALPPRKAA